MDVTTKDPVTELEEGLQRLIDRFNERLRSEGPTGSRALSFAVAAGLPPRMAYSLTETARYTGIDRQQLDAERKAGRLACIVPEGCVKGYRITVDEMDRWMRENAR